MERSKSVGAYIAKQTQWKAELTRLRTILTSTKLVEDVKWGAPCYTYAGKNVVGVAAFKAHFALWFHQGALIDDDAGVLVNAQQGRTKALRQWRMTSAKDIKAAVIKRYVVQAIAIVDGGKEIKPDRSKKSVVVPDELRNGLRRTKGATAAFNKMPPSHQREYAEYVAEAKRDDTKKRRVDKILPMIVGGGGLNDRYR